MANYEVKNQSFLADNVDLKRLLSAVKKTQKKTIQTLLTLCSSTDETIRLKAASKLLELQVEVAKEISADQMKRLIAEIKVNPSNTPLVPTEEDKRPRVAFDEIIDMSVD